MKAVAGVDFGARLRTGMTFALLSGVLVLGWQAMNQGALGASASDCVSDSRGVRVHFRTDYSTGDPAISGVELVGLDPKSCDGETVTVTLSGNDDGDPSKPPTRLLSSLDSSLDPCTGEPARPPVVVSGGRILLPGCATVTTPSGAAYADLHDATRLSIEVAGHGLPIGGGPDDSPPTDAGAAPDPDVAGTDTSTDDSGDDGPDGPDGPDVLGVQEFADGPPGRADVPTAVDAGGVMPDTGGPRTLMLWIGVALVIFGGLSLVRDMFRPRRPSPPGPGRN
jgi:hypothetical protein